jgi:purine-nucleoside phosphorylase
MFDDARLVTEVRGMLGFTGTVDGMPVSVLASGMGMASMTIYATELVREYGARRLVRVGTTGALQESIEVGDVIAASAAHTDSSMTQLRIPGVNFSHVASFPLLRAAVDFAEAHGHQLHVGPVLTTDHFYLERPGLHEALIAYGTLSIEMETAALYAVAAEAGIDALSILTVSDHIVRGESLSAELRETNFADMVRIALASVAGEA